MKFHKRKDRKLGQTAVRRVTSTCIVFVMVVHTADKTVLSRLRRRCEQAITVRKNWSDAVPLSMNDDGM